MKRLEWLKQPRKFPLVTVRFMEQDLKRFYSFTVYRSAGEDPVFILSAHLMSPVTELEYLRKISELYILFLLPPSYSLSPIKFLLREILTCKSKHYVFFYKKLIC